MQLLPRLLENSAIIIAFQHIELLMFRETGVNSRSSLKTKVLYGLLCGVLGCLLIAYSIDFGQIIVDLRLIPIILAAYSGGIFPSLLAAVIIGLFRVLYFGDGITSPSAVALVTAVIHACVSSYICARFKGMKAYFLALLVCLGITMTAVVSFIEEPYHKLVELSTTYLPLILASGYVILLSKEHTDTINGRYRRFRDESNHDYLTGLSNVRNYDIMLNKAFTEALAENSPMSLLAIDIDFFKRINDIYGHMEGDLILKQVAEVLRESCPSPENLFRTGGEEFSIILPGSDSHQAFRTAQDIRQTVESSEFRLSNQGIIPITISIGLATSPSQTSDITQLKRIADFSLYAAKDYGRNRVETKVI